MRVQTFSWRSTLLILALLLTLPVFAGPPYFLSELPELQLSDKQKLELLDAPAKLVEQQAPHLVSSIQAGPERVLLLGNQPEPWQKGDPFDALIIYSPVTVSLSRSVDPMVVCEGQGSPVTWVTCYEKSRVYANLPAHRPIKIDDLTMTDERLVKMLAAIDKAQIRAPSGSLITSIHVDHVHWRGDRAGVYAVLTGTAGGEGATVNLRPILKNGAESYEVTEYECR